MMNAKGVFPDYFIMHDGKNNSVELRTKVRLKKSHGRYFFRRVIVNFKLDESPFWEQINRIHTIFNRDVYATIILGKYNAKIKSGGFSIIDEIDPETISEKDRIKNEYNS